MIFLLMYALSLSLSLSRTHIHTHTHTYTLTHLIIHTNKHVPLWNVPLNYLTSIFSGIEVKFKNMLYPIIIAPTSIPEMTECSKTDSGLCFGGAVTLTEMEKFMKKFIEKLPGNTSYDYIDVIIWFSVFILTRYMFSECKKTLVHGTKHRFYYSILIHIQLSTYHTKIGNSRSVINLVKRWHFF